MKRINEAIESLQKYKYKSVDVAIQRLKELQSQGVRKLDSLFGMLILELSNDAIQALEEKKDLGGFYTLKKF
jgi:hypothetical protein